MRLSRTTPAVCRGCALCTATPMSTSATAPLVDTKETDVSNKYTASKQGRTHGGYRKRLEARGVERSPQTHYRLSDGKLSDAKR